jgi:hypothetical protein
MMNRIRTRIESKRANNQLQSYYLWRPAPGRGPTQRQRKRRKLSELLPIQHGH